MKYQELNFFLCKQPFTYWLNTVGDTPSVAAAVHTLAAVGFAEYLSFSNAI